MALLPDLRSHTQPHSQHGMAPPNTRARANWAMERATALPEVWALVVKHRGVLGARRLMRVCKARERGDWSICAPCRGSWCAAGIVQVRK